MGSATAFSDGVLQVWSTDNKRPSELDIRTDIHETPPRSITESTAPRSDMDMADTASVSSVTTASVLVDQSACPTFDVSDLLASEKQSQQKHSTSAGWNLAATAEALERKIVTAEALEQEINALGKRSEAATPRRFWREIDDSKKSREEVVVTFNDETE